MHQLSAARIKRVRSLLRQSCAVPWRKRGVIEVIEKRSNEQKYVVYTRYVCKTWEFDLQRPQGGNVLSVILSLSAMPVWRDQNAEEDATVARGMRILKSDLL